MSQGAVLYDKSNLNRSHSETGTLGLNPAFPDKPIAETGTEEEET